MWPTLQQLVKSSLNLLEMKTITRYLRAAFWGDVYSSDDITGTAVAEDADCADAVADEAAAV